MPRNGLFGNGYVVISGAPGYMAETAWHCQTLAEAYEIAKEEKEFWREGGYHVEGNIRDRRYYINDRFSDYGYHVWTIAIYDCEEPEPWIE